MSIKKAARQVVEKEDLPVVVPREARVLSPEEILGALTYCYARGIFCSSEIETRMLRDPEFREALKNEVPRPAVLRRFRGLNHGAIIAVLEKYYRQERKRLKREQCQPSESEFPTSVDTVRIAKQKAVDCLHTAMLIDNVLRED